MNTKKPILFRMVTLMMAMFTLAMVMAFPVSASAAEAPASVSAAAVEAAPLTASVDPAAMAVQAARFAPMIVALEGEAPAGGASLGSQTDGDAQFQAVVTFFVKWIKRVGLLVAFVGGVMFALAIKNNDAEQKQGGLLTMVAGFVVSALCQAVSMFDIFS